ncbi:DUF4157 domain-containing protein [Streptomyces sp. NPDC005728]|uniref:eCIS core domain-containing protein n=1 Tax=Streptomyces sp. NPDC005728 TaxID=3157054 RepID=UPI0033EF205A
MRDTDRQQRSAEPRQQQGRPRQDVRVPAALGARLTAAGLAGQASPEATLALQRAIGNRAFTRLAAREHEQQGAACGETDARSHEPDLVGGDAVQRLVDEQTVQRDALDRVDAVTRTVGSALPAQVQRRMESDYGGEDFSDVRVHVDRDSAESVGAKAYTTKTNHIVFRSAGDMDDHTMRHELQHVRQQRAGRVPSGVSHPGDTLEHEAEDTAVRIGRSPTGSVQRSAVAEPGAAPAAQSAAGGAVQRMVLKTGRDLYQQWGGDGPALVPAQKNWLWSQLLRLGGGQRNVTAMKLPDALKLLADNNVTRELMDQEVGQPSAPPQPQGPKSREEYDAEAKNTVDEADALWRAREPQMPRLDTVAFHVEGLGRGTVAMLRSPSGPRHSNMLAWFSHGYEDKHPIAIDTERTYGFAVQEEKSLKRIGASAEVYASLPDAMAASGRQPTKDAPGAYVQPHHATELTQQIDLVVGLVNHCDVAVLLDFQWSETPAEEFTAARAAGTPPLPVIIERAEALAKYGSLLIFACRTPWSVNAGAEGSSVLKANYRRELLAQGRTPEQAEKETQDRYEASPTEGLVYP